MIDALVSIVTVVALLAWAIGGMMLYAGILIGVPCLIFGLIERIRGKEFGGKRLTPAEFRAARQQQYRRYLASGVWQQRRTAAVERAGGKCQRCGSRARLEVHHKTYVNVYAERPEDLEVLCAACHHNHHFEGY